MNFTGTTSGVAQTDAERVSPDRCDIDSICNRLGELCANLQGNNDRLGRLASDIFGPTPETCEEACDSAPSLLSILGNLEREVRRQNEVLARF